jgi:hypothetical protein
MRSLVAVCFCHRSPRPAYLACLGEHCAINELVSRSAYAFPWAARALEGEPTFLISHGQPIHKALRRSGISLSELRATARRQGFSSWAVVDRIERESPGARCQGWRMPSRSIAAAFSIRARRVSSRFASSIQRTYSFL